MRRERVVRVPRSPAKDHKKTGDPVAVVRRLGSIAPAGQVLKVCSRKSVREALADGRLVRVGHRKYALPGLAQARSDAARLGGVLAGLSAAAYWGWKVKDPAPRPCVLLRRGLKRDPHDYGDVEVRWGLLPDSDVHDGPLGRVTSPLRTVVDCLRWLPEDAALAVADSALRSRRIGKEELIASVERSPHVGRPRALRLAHLADRRAANPFESVLRWIASTVPGLEIEAQGDVDGIGKGDVVDRRLRLVLEAESHEFHTEKVAFRRDCRRYTAMVRAGWRVIRFVWEDVMNKPDYVREVLADLVAFGPATYRSHSPGIDPRVMGGE
jgi:very-short-patch-repair endonuclease